MQKSNSKRREDLALVAAWSRAIYNGRELVGHAHPVDAGWLGEDADGSIVGVFPKERQAVVAVLDAARRL